LTHNFNFPILIPSKSEFLSIRESVELFFNTRPIKCLNYLTLIEVLSKGCCTYWLNPAPEGREEGEIAF